MARVRLRSRRAVLERCGTLTESVRAALEQLQGNGDPSLQGSVWAGESLGVLLWALRLAQLPAYDRPFDYARLIETPLDNAELRPSGEIAEARETSRLWLWRARTAELQSSRSANVLPPQWQSFDQLVGATAMRAHERGLLPKPVRGDFPAFGAAYRELDDGQLAEAHLLAWHRHHALSWLCGLGTSWEEVPTDT